MKAFINSGQTNVMKYSEKSIESFVTVWHMFCKGSLKRSSLPVWNPNHFLNLYFWSAVKLDVYFNFIQVKCHEMNCIWVLHQNIVIKLHKKWSFPLRISSVNVTKSSGNCGFGHICWRNPQWKTSFFVPC